GVAFRRRAALPLRNLGSQEANMIEWNEMHLQIREMMRRFVEQEVKPNLEKLEHGDLPPYEILRKMIKSFGIADMAKARFARDKDRPPRSDDAPKKPSEERGMEVAMQMIPIIELCRYSPGMVTALGVSMGLTPAAIMSRGTVRQ